MVQFLVENGADVNAQNSLALQEASLNGHLDTVQFLVQQGANVHAMDDGALMRSSENGHLGVVQFLVENGADVNARDNEALILASTHGFLEVVRFLVDHGANPYARDNQAALMAANMGHDEIVQYFYILNNPAQQNIVFRAEDHVGFNECPICYTEFQENEEITQLPCHQHHIFHNDCIAEWINMNPNRTPNCPTCRRVFRAIIN